MIHRSPKEPPIHPEARISHVQLKVADLDRAVTFYRDGLGFAVTGRVEDGLVYLAAGGYHHHLALNAWKRRDAGPPPPGASGLSHVAILYPTRRELARAVERLLDHGLAIRSAADHGVNQAVYLRDPDGNGIALSWDRDPAAWPRDEGGALIVVNDPLDLEDLLAELEPAGLVGRG